MAAKRSRQELAEIAAFIKGLYVLGGYASWAEFARDAKLQAPQLSGWKNGEVEPASLNLVKLIQASAARAAVSPVEAAQESVGAGPLERIADGIQEILANQREALGVLKPVRRAKRQSPPKAPPKRKRRA